MKHLEKGKDYDVCTLEDLVNAPLNMTEEAMNCIKNAWSIREEKAKSGENCTFRNAAFILTNDGIDRSTIEVSSKG